MAMKSGILPWCFGITAGLLLLYVYIFTHISQDATVSRKLASFGQVVNQTGSLQVATKPARKDDCNACFTPNLQHAFMSNYACLPTNLHDSIVGSKEPKIDLIVLVSSATIHKANRMAIRNTWGRWSQNNTANVRIVFVVGVSLSLATNQKILTEQAKFKDIVQGDFMDSYENLTFQTVTGINWAVHFCPHARFVFKTDDDVWVNIPALLRILPLADLENTVGGRCYHGEYPRRVNIQSKWFISYQDFPRDVYPGYCSGAGYVMPMQVARDISQVSKDTPFFRFEDVYIGLCIEKLGYHVRELPGFNVNASRLDMCEMRMDHVITSHEFCARDLITVWNHKSDCSCPTYCRYIRYFLCVILLIWTIILFIFLYRCYIKRHR